MIPNEAEFLEALRKVTQAFATLGIDYAISGAYASSLYGEARATRGVDLVAAVAGRHAKPLADALGSDFYADEAQILAAAQNQGSFNLIHLGSMSKIDVFAVWRTEFGRTQLERKRRVNVGRPETLELCVTSPEDTVLAKLNWYKDGGCISDRQWADVLGVLRVQAGALDAVYLRNWAARLGLSDLLNRALQEAESL